MYFPTATEFLLLAKDRGHSIFDSKTKPYNLNIVGFRNVTGRVNHFDDLIAVYYLNQFGTWMRGIWPASTCPGAPWLLNPISPRGTAILVPGQYHEVYELGTFHGHQALKQVGALKVYRDNNKDLQLDENAATIQEGLFGIHIHRAGIWSQLVGPSSAGCQVFQKSADCDEFIWLCEQAVDYWGNRFTYTLMEI